MFISVLVLVVLWIVGYCVEKLCFCSIHVNMNDSDIRNVLENDSLISSGVSFNQSVGQPNASLGCM